MGIIYQIVCNQTGERYIGSTTKTLSYKMSKHKQKDNQACSKQILDRGDYTADILEETELEGIELLKREQYYMDTMDCINKQRSYGSLTRRQYYLKNREKQLKQEKEYRQRNKDKIKERKKQLYHYQLSWGGNKKYHNNLLCIDVDLFRV